MKKALNIILVMSMMFSLSCTDDFEDINRPPKNPTLGHIKAQFNGVMSSMKMEWGEQAFLHNEEYYPATQLAGKYKNVGVDAVVRSNSGIWNSFYDMMKNARKLESELDAYTLYKVDNIRGMLKIFMAGRALRVVDYFGDIPYSEAGYAFFSGSEQILRPKFEDQKALYATLLKELEDGVNMLVENPGEDQLGIGNYDPFFAGNAQMWKRFANSLRLRYAMRMAEKDPGAASAIIQNVVQSGLILEEGQDVGVWYQAFGFTDWVKRWAFSQGGGSGLRLGTNTWRLISDSDEKDGSGIFDPRAYIFFEPNNAGEWRPYPQVPDAGTDAEGGRPYHNKRKNDYSNKGEENLFSPFNVYLILDEEYIPELWVTSSETKFVLAEAYLRGIGVSKDEAMAKQYYEAGISESVIFWDKIAENTPMWQNKPEWVTANKNDEVLAALFDHPKVKYEGTEAEKLEKIYSQRWLSHFRQPDQAYFLTYRTRKTPKETPFSENLYRLRYPDGENVNNNENYKAAVANIGGRDDIDVKIWWMQ
ncbi:SusD/RagB family nutrient-binding outer membrane lipoprotein [Fulvitalea axinellae]